MLFIVFIYCSEIEVAYRSIKLSANNYNYSLHVFEIFMYCSSHYNNQFLILSWNAKLVVACWILEFEQLRSFGYHNGIVRTLKKLRTSKGDHWIKQWFSSIASLFKMGTSLKGQNLLPLYEQFLIVWKITLIYRMKWPPLNVTIFITHMSKLPNGCYTNVSDEQSIM